MATFVRICAAVFLALAIGCEHLQLEHHTLQQAKTLTDLQYRQVLDNLAMFHANPSALPFYSLAGTGQTNINLQASANVVPNWDLLTNAGKALTFHFDKINSTIGGQETAQDQWTTLSVLNPDELEMIRAAYQRTVGDGSGEWSDRLDQYFQKYNPSLLNAMHPGWVHFGSKVEVPHAARYVGHYGCTYAWVLEDGEDELTKFTLAVLDIATAVAPAQGGIASGHPGTPADKVAAKTAVISAYAAEVRQLLDFFKDAPAPMKDQIQQQLQVSLKKYLNALKLDVDQKPPVTADEAAVEVYQRFQQELEAIQASPAPTLRQRKSLYVYPLPNQ